MPGCNGGARPPRPHARHTPTSRRVRSGDSLIVQADHRHRLQHLGDDGVRVEAGARRTCARACRGRCRRRAAPSSGRARRRPAGPPRPDAAGRRSRSRRSQPSSTVISTSCSRASRSTSSVSSGLAKRASATVVEQAARREFIGRLQAFGEPGAERQQRDAAMPSRSTRPLPISSGTPRVGHARRRRPRRADSGRRSGPRHGRRRSRTMCISSASSAAAITTMLGRQPR